jgi:hypothetical protein
LDPYPTQPDVEAPEVAAQLFGLDGGAEFDLVDKPRHVGRATSVICCSMESAASAESCLQLQIVARKYLVEFNAISQ